MKANLSSITACFIPTLIASVLTSCMAPDSPRPTRKTAAADSISSGKGPEDGSQGTVVPSSNTGPKQTEASPNKDKDKDGEKDGNSNSTPILGKDGVIPITGATGPGCIKWETLKDPSELACAGSVENVFSQLPPWLSANFSLMKSSESSQAGTQANPRVIMYDPAMNFVVATSTKAGVKSLEVIVFDHSKEEWKFGEIDFTDSKAPRLQNKDCSSCHGSQFHVIWKNYPVWKGAVGIADSFDVFVQDRDQSMTAADASFLNAAAAKSAEIPEILKNLKFEKAGYYKAGEIFWTAVVWRENSNSANESQLGLNYLISYRAPRTYANKIMGDQTITRKQKFEIVHGIFCGRDYIKALESTPYKPKVYLNHDMNKDGVERVSTGWDAQVGEPILFGAELFRRMLESDPALKAALPEALPLYDHDDYKFILTKGTKEGLSYWLDKKMNLYKPSVYTRDTIAKYLKTAKVCQVLAAP